ncbi:MAG TPA: hypothetical protein PLN21_12350 [Gemmatales bacterium]|nr:hypothetical protein [Gemmatales bacterium]
MTKRKRPIVWVIMHYEIMFDDHIDSLQFHVSSTRKKAEEYIDNHGMSHYSWWQIHSHRIDHDFKNDGEEGVEVYYYSHTGRPLKSAPQKQALAAYQRAKKRGEVG